ncbi:MAG: hypothetical protein K2O97_02385 [Acetatifactor sp.]|nr:hypothetical protein [Acetatifactor sp.]MDE7043858.1 hypothetical protein [Acetatifactor sp.]
MKRRTGSLRFRAVTILLIMVTAFCSAGTALSRTAFSGGELENYYCELECQLVEEAREYLERQGYRNSGVMLTRVVDMDGSREYTLSIHHGRIVRLNEEERERLTGVLEELAFTDRDCTFCVKVL